MTYFIKNPIKTLLLLSTYLLSSFITLSAETETQSKVTYLFTAKDGLSSTKVTSMVQDHRGYVWMGTEDGLNKYDGFNFVTYKNNQNDTLSLKNNHVTALFQDSENRIWIATIEGLLYYESAYDRFVNTALNLPDYIIKNNHCVDIIEDRKGQLWFTASGFGVVSYSPKEEKSKLLAPLSTQPTTLCSQYIQSMLEDQEGKIWMGSRDNGISVYDPEKEAYINYNTSNSDLCGNTISDLFLLKNGDILITTLRDGACIYDAEKGSLISYPDVFNTANVRSLLCGIEDHAGNLLIGTENTGIWLFDPDKRTLERHPVFREYLDLIGDTKVRYIYEGAHNYLWTGLNYKGIFCVGHEDSGFKSLRKINDNPNSLNCRAVTGITTDKNKNIWIATDGGGLNGYHPLTKRFTHYTYSLTDSTSISDNAATSVFCDSKNRIWVGTLTGGLCLFNDQSGTFTRFCTKTTGLRSDYINCIQEDKYGHIWIGTFGGGLSRLDPNEMVFKTYLSGEHPGLVNDYIFRLFADSKNRLWIGTNYGLSHLDIKTQSFREFNKDSGLSSIVILSISEDTEGTIWVGTANGLNRYDEEQNRLTLVYPKRRELSSTINGLVTHDNQLWMSTNHGVIRYTPKSEEIKRYYYNSGLPNNEFIAGAYYKNQEGEIFFGGVDGLIFFYPDDIYNYDAASNVIITHLKINNAIVNINEEFGGKVILTKNIGETKKITLNHTIKNFTMEYVAMDIFDSYSVVYAYMLEGFDKNWLYTDYKNKSVTYTNLNPGTYSFKIKASSNPDVWDDEATTLIIEIKPAPWNTWWAKLIYVFIFCTAIYMVLKFFFTRLREKNELHIQRLKMKQQEDINTLKTNFLTNISHEVRTPLTLITGPLKRLINEELDEERKKTGFLILRNAERLQRLVNQLLNISKIEEGKVHLNVQKIELASFISDLVVFFNELTKQKQISLTYKRNTDEVHIWYDADMLDKCLNNLLFNAYKYTPENGEIDIELTKTEDKYAIITVRDTGIGMKTDVLEHVFDRFFQGSGGLYSGSGLGMYLTKTLIELHKGTIRAESEEGKGSAFTVTILLGNDHFTPEQFLNSKNDIPVSGYKPNTFDQPEEASLPAIDSTSAMSKPNGDKFLLLLIEDDSDMRQYIRKELEDIYQIEEATNGTEGLAKARRLLPDLIITDVMMPEMDGKELCKILKNEEDTCHIPVVLLTAQAELEQRLEGLETGADSYISKPFNTDYLRVRINNLLETRQKLKERFSKSFHIDTKDLTLTSFDERLLQNTMDYIRNNIENSDLSVETMSKDLGLSRSHLHRKLKALTGQSPIEFIKMTRMKQAATLLRTGKLTITEVAYKVGYNTPSYFSNSFNSYFGMSPSEFIEKNKETK